MKKVLFIIGLLICISSICRAQGFTYNYIRNYAQGMGYNIGQEWNSQLQEGQYFTKTFTFDRNVQYDIIALSEDGNVLDVDMEILTPSGYVYDSNNRSSRFAEVVFTPSYDRTLTIKVKNCSSCSPYYASKVYFIVAYR